MVKKKKLFEQSKQSLIIFGKSFVTFQTHISTPRDPLKPLFFFNKNICSPFFVKQFCVQAFVARAYCWVEMTRAICPW